jgi:hypothetical protein
MDPKISCSIKPNKAQNLSQSKLDEQSTIKACSKEPHLASSSWERRNIKYRRIQDFLFFTKKHPPELAVKRTWKAKSHYANANEVHNHHHPQTRLWGFCGGESVQQKNHFFGENFLLV